VVFYLKHPKMPELTLADSVKNHSLLPTTIPRTTSIAYPMHILYQTIFANFLRADRLKWPV
jgi:hypothetical protein